MSSIGNGFSRLPIAPLFLSDYTAKWIELEATIITERKLFKPGATRQFEFIGYDACRTKWKMQYERPTSSVLDRLIQHFRAPNMIVPVRWQECGSYPIEELRAVFLKAVEHDDDVLTQFVEREELVQRLSNATEFEELLRIWNWLSAAG